MLLAIIKLYVRFMFLNLQNEQLCMTSVAGASESLQCFQLGCVIAEAVKVGFKLVLNALLTQQTVDAFIYSS